jgi:hypothetical protein
MAHNTSELNTSPMNITETRPETDVHLGRADDAEISAFLRTIDSVLHDLAELERLLKVDSVEKRLKGTPEKLPYIEKIAHNTKAALKEMEILIEREGANQTANASAGDCPRREPHGNVELMNYRLEITICHQALSTALAFLNPLEKPLVNRQAKPPNNSTSNSVTSDSRNLKPIATSSSGLVNAIDIDLYLMLISQIPTSKSPKPGPSCAVSRSACQSSSSTVHSHSTLSISQTAPPNRPPPAVPPSAAMSGDRPMTMAEQRRNNRKELVELMEKVNQ